MKPVIIYDGYCNLCVYIVKKLIANTSEPKFKFVAAQNSEARALLRKYSFSFVKLNSIYFIENDKVYMESIAVKKILCKMPKYLFFSKFLNLVPNFIANIGYKLIARTRYFIFGKRKVIFEVP